MHPTHQCSKTDTKVASWARKLKQTSPILKPFCWVLVLYPISSKKSYPFCVNNRVQVNPGRVVMFSLVKRSENQKHNQTTAELPFVWVFGFQFGHLQRKPEMKGYYITCCWGWANTLFSKHSQFQGAWYGSKAVNHLHCLIKKLWARSDKLR